MMISISVTKNTPVAVEENKLRKEKKSWKMMENTLINLYCIDFFYCNKKIAKNRQELLHQININLINIVLFLYICISIMKYHKSHTYKNCKNNVV